MQRRKEQAGRSTEERGCDSARKRREPRRADHCHERESKVKHFCPLGNDGVVLVHALQIAECRMQWARQKQKSLFRGLLCKKLRFETYPPVAEGTLKESGYVSLSAKHTNPHNSYPPVGTFRNVTYYTTDPRFVLRSRAAKD